MGRNDAALEYAVGYSTGPQSTVFLEPDLKPIRDLKVIVNDIPVRASPVSTVYSMCCALVREGEFG